MRKFDEDGMKLASTLIEYLKKIMSDTSSLQTDKTLRSLDFCAMEQTTSALSWEHHCIVELIRAASQSSPTAIMSSMIRNGHLHVPAMHQIAIGPAQSEDCHLSICGITLVDDTFARDSKTLIQRLFLSMLRNFVKLNETTVGIAWTVLAHRLQNELGIDMGEKELDDIHELMSQSTISLPSSTSHNSGFHYRALSQEIRLLVLLPPTLESQRIRCRLIHQSVHNCASYEALSYIWGDQNKRFDISVDDCDFSVTSNLFEALKARRHPQKERILWVDAICIDQSNSTEKTQQVNLMGDIYHQAQLVTAWLGPESPERIVKIEEMDMLINSDNYKANPSDHKDYLQTIISLFSEEYFTRAWIVQELLLAKRVIIQCGAHRWPLDYVLVYYFHVRDRMPSLARRGGHPSYMERVVEDNRNAKHDPFSTSLFHNLTLFYFYGDNIGEPDPDAISCKWEHPEQILDAMRQRSCLDPRDRVFSTLAIHRYRTQLSPSLVEPDYSSVVEEVFISAAKNIILATQSLNILSRSESFYTKRSSILPSWVPSWGGKGSPQMLHGYTTQLMYFAFPPITVGSASMDVQFTNHDRLLHARGWKVDAIDRTLNINFSDERSFISSTLQLLMETSSASREHVCGTESFWKSLLHLISVAEREYHEMYLTQIPPNTLAEAFEILKKFWAELRSNEPAWYGPDGTTGLRVFLTRNGTYLVAPLEAIEGDNVVIFPNSYYVHLLRDTCEFHRVLGPW
jgi:hypothetical protein